MMLTYLPTFEVGLKYSGALWWTKICYKQSTGKVRLALYVL